MIRPIGQEKIRSKEEVTPSPEGRPEDKLRSFKEEWTILSDEEIEEKDPEKTWVDIEDVSEEQALDKFVSDFNIDEKTSDMLKSGYEEFENIDLFKEMIEEARERKEEEEREFEAEKKKLKTYSPKEFQFLEKVAVFKALIDKVPMIKKERPTWAKTEKPLTDGELAELIKEYKETKRKGDWSEYSKAEIKFMKEASVWRHFYNKITQESPTDASGRLLTKKEIDEVAEEYENFKKEKPKEFAELKYGWLREKFDWQFSEFKGKPQWICYKSKVVEDEKGEKIKLTRKYIIDRIPADIKPEEIKESFFTIKTVYKPNDTFSIVFIELKPPFIVPKEKEKALY